MWWSIRFYLKECKDFRLGKVILEKWDSVGKSSYVFGQHFLSRFHVYVGKSVQRGPSDHPSLPCQLIPPAKLYFHFRGYWLTWASLHIYRNQIPNGGNKLSPPVSQDKAFLLLLLILNIGLIHTVYRRIVIWTMSTRTNF